MSSITYTVCNCLDGVLGKWLVNLIHGSSGIGVVQVDVDDVAEESLFDGEAVAADDLSRRSSILINYVKMVKHKRLNKLI